MVDGGSSTAWPIIIQSGLVAFKHVSRTGMRDIGVAYHRHFNSSMLDCFGKFGQAKVSGAKS